MSEKPGSAALKVSNAAGPFGTWPYALAGEPAFRSDPGRRFDALLEEGRLSGIHGVVALRGCDIVFERYFDGGDAAWGEDLGTVHFGPETLHDLRSVTKSIVGLLYGIALSWGKVPDLDQPLLAHFPDYQDLATQPQRMRILVRHALTMTLGLEWDENLPYTSAANSEIAMEEAPDRIRFILERPILAEPGRGWIYSGGAAALLGKLIEDGTGQSLPHFAEEALFRPLGIDAAAWSFGRDGTPSAASGLRLSPRSLCRIGQLILQGGQWEGRTVVPSSWLQESFTAAAIVDIGWPGMYYGYLWYLAEEPVTERSGTYGARFLAALGNGGQRLFIFPGLDFVLAISAGNYDRPDHWRAPAALLYEVFLPSLLRTGDD